MAGWLACWTCNFGVQGSILHMGSKHFSLLSVLGSAIFPGQILKINRKVPLESFLSVLSQNSYFYSNPALGRFMLSSIISFNRAKMTVSHQYSLTSKQNSRNVLWLWPAISHQCLICWLCRPVLETSCILKVIPVYWPLSSSGDEIDVAKDLSIFQTISQFKH